MPTQLVQAVLFDLDRTLIDSTASVNRNWRIVADLMGRPAEDVVGRFHGMPGRKRCGSLTPTLSDHEVAILDKVLIDGRTADTSDVIALPGGSRPLAATTAGSWPSSPVVRPGSPRPGWRPPDCPSHRQW